ncbi:hypothetical protein THTE_1423 [Thermogutta terrifontis]|uniref:Uncharacterized protein n=1 Tax=Thermogutta terrifontis TaxID=1331910 RepID=A0A286RDH9_9BACT|nr:hypothetical protein THTE_1423 [Thermogutta terrifontis]
MPQITCTSTFVLLRERVAYLTASVAAVVAPSNRGTILANGLFTWDSVQCPHFGGASARRFFNDNCPRCVKRLSARGIIA